MIKGIFMMLCFKVLVSYSQISKCIGSPCSGCTSGYLYYKTCVPLCPSSFVQTSVCTATSTHFLFDIIFLDFSVVNASSIGNFSHPQGLPFQDSGQQSPIPTKERGFYFVSTSKLVSNYNWIPAPDFTFAAHFKLTADGTMFVITSGGINYFKVTLSSGSIIVSWYLSLMASPYTSSSQTFTDSSKYTLGVWNCFYVAMSFASNLITISMPGFQTTVPNYEFLGQISGLNWYIGDPNSGNTFTGFLMEIWVENMNWPYCVVVIATFTSQSCAFNQYYDFNTSTCQNCSSGCGTWPWCVWGNTCSICEKGCSTCTGYKFKDCSACSTGGTAPACLTGLNCAVGFNFDCTQCNSGFTLINGLCINPPYNYNAAALGTPAISIDFGFISQYYGGIFQSGANANTWAPFNSPDSDDPYPAKNRGLYFDGVSKFLKTKNGASFAMNSQFSIAMWIYPMNYNPTFNNANFAHYAIFYASIVISNAAEAYQFYTESYNGYTSVWTFQAFTVSFVSDVTSIYSQYNGGWSQVFSCTDYAFYDTIGTAYIGSYQGTSSLNYKGFISTFTLWQTSIYDFSSSYNYCGTSKGSTCFWNCVIGNYYNSYQSSYLACDTSCVNGCSTWGTCSLCQSTDCTSCSNLNTTCVSSTINPCLTGLHYTSTKNCCSPICADCYGPSFNNCLPCTVGQSILGVTCVASCPLGFTSVSGTCVATLNPFLSLTLNKIQDQVSDSISAVTFETGNTNAFYPTGTSSDPIPALQRGYYFNTTSFMKSGTFLMPYNFTIVLYIKQISPGIIFTKGAMSLQTSAVITNFTITSVISTKTSAIGITNWTIFALQLFTGNSSNTQLSVIYPLNQALSNSTAATNVLFVDTLSSLILGSNSGSFQGFIYNFTIFSTVIPVSSYSLTVCVSDTSANCLMNCDIGLYLNGTTCKACSGSCSNGCRRDSNCNLCVDSICEICLDFQSNCSNCLSNASINSNTGTCECDLNFNWNEGSNQCALSKCTNGFYLNYQNGACEACNRSCLQCNGGTFYQCTNCSNFLLESVCVSLCPVGYFVSNNACVSNSLNGPAISFVFDKILGVFQDSINSIYAITGINPSTYPYLDQTDPIPAYERGIYFNGIGSYLTMPYTQNNFLLLGIRFYFSIWLNLIEPNGFLVSRNTNKLNVWLVNAFPKINIVIDAVNYYFTSNIPLTTNKWSHLMVNVAYNSYTSISFTVNHIASNYISLFPPFLDDLNSALIIGSNTFFSSYYTGFIYSFEIFTYAPNIFSLSSVVNCSTCGICLPNFKCLPTCDLNFYPDNILICIDCHANCTYGCRNNETCNLCEDINCLDCDTFGSNSCSECLANYELQNASCIQCNSTSYYNFSLKSCVQCPELCIECVSSSICVNCTDNSHIDNKNSCVCNQGYILKNHQCVAAYFAAFITIAKDNTITLVFTEPLNNNLVNSDLSLNFGGFSPNYVLGFIDSSTYTITLNLNVTVYEGNTLLINFTHQLFSANNLLLFTKSFQITLFAIDQSSILSEVNRVKYYSTIGMGVGIFSALGSCTINLSLLPLFTFMNNAEIFTYAILFNTNLSPILIAFLNDLQINSNIPNLFSFVLDKNQGVQLTGNLNLFGDITNLLLLNSGIYMMIFIFFVLLFTVLSFSIKTKAEWAKIYLLKLLGYLKYKAFLRLWIQVFLETFFNSITGIYYSKLQNGVQILDFLVCCITLVNLK